MNKNFTSFLFFGFTASALAATDPVKEYQAPVQKGAALMQVCGESFGQPYAGVPKILNDKYLHLLELSGKKPRKSSQHEKKILTMVKEERKLQRTQRDCKSELFRMKGFVSRMDKDIQALEKTDTPQP